jgi:molybdopterin molybdotransferase
MISFDEAVELVRSIATPLAAETVPIAEAAGRVLARPVTADLDSPRSDVSAMDGYAVREEDLNRFPASLRLVGHSYAGSGWKGSVEPGTSVRIFTGAPVPPGADRVVMQENVRCTGDAVIIAEQPGPARYIRKRASDFAQGDELLAAGRLLNARALVVAAGADVAKLEVYRRPRLHILSTGDELAEPGTARERTDAIPESVSFGVAALALQWGAECTGRIRVGDDLPRMEELARAATDDDDLVVVTGGASVGEKDFAKRMFEPLGLEIIFSKVSIKPGKPVWLGRAEGTLVLGLPGNPTSALVTARLFLASLVAGARALEWRAMPLASSLGPCGPRETFHRARDACGSAEVLPSQDSGAQKALAQANLLVRQRADTPALNAGDTVEVLQF